MRRLLELAVTLAIGAGLPLTQFAIRRMGRPAAAGSAVVTVGLLAANLADLAARRSDGPLRRIVRVETLVAAVAAVTGAILLLDPDVTEARDEGWRIGRAEMLRRLSLGLLFGLRSARFRLEAEQRGEQAGEADAAGPAQ